MKCGYRNDQDTSIEELDQEYARVVNELSSQKEGSTVFFAEPNMFYSAKEQLEDDGIRKTFHDRVLESGTDVEFSGYSVSTRFGML